MSDKTVAELMALADAYAVSSGVDGQHDTSCDSKYTAARRAALEQAIRRALDWGEPVAAVTASQELRWLISKEEAAERGGMFGQHLYAKRKDQWVT